MRTYIGTFCLAILSGLVATPLVILLARRIGAVDAPGVRRVHDGPIPRIGGVAIVVATALAVLPVLLLTNAVGEAFHMAWPQVLTVLGAAAGMFLVGLVDDLRGLRARTKFLAQVVAAFCVCLVGVRSQIVSLPGVFTVDLGWWAWPLTMLWIVGVTNAVNLIDGLDGLAAGIAAITCAVLAALAWHGGMQIMTVVMLALLGSLSAFLAFNSNPAKVFMGDCGSLFLGFMLASFSVLCATKTETVVGLALPALAMGVPIFDTLFSMLRRVLERRGMMAPDRGHIHHRLIDMGMTHRHVAVILYLITATAAGLGMFMMVTRDVGTVIIFGAVVMLLIIAFHTVGSVRLRDITGRLRRNVELAREKALHKRRFELGILYMREANDFQSWWKALCHAAESMELARLSMTLTNRDGGTTDLTWNRPETDQPDPVDLLTMTVPCPDRRASDPLTLAVHVPIHGSLEAAGRTAGHLGRLMEEHGVATLPEGGRDA